MAAADGEIRGLGWEVGRFLGEGAFGVVKLVTRKSDGLRAACKIMPKPKDQDELLAVEVHRTGRAPAQEPLSLLTRLSSSTSPHTPFVLASQIETKIMRECDHPGVVKCYEAAETDGQV